MNVLEREVRGLDFLEKLLVVYEKGDVDFWEERIKAPNLSRDEFTKVLYRVERVENLRWVERESENGLHGNTGEHYCFKFSCSIQFGGIFEIESKSFFIKGYFFEQGNLKGVTIQSFREA